MCIIQYYLARPPPHRNFITIQGHPVKILPVKHYTLYYIYIYFTVTFYVAEYMDYPPPICYFQIHPSLEYIYIIFNVTQLQDKMMVSFLNTGDWFKESGVKPVEKYVPPRNYFSVINMVFWSLFTLVPFFYLAFNILISGNLNHMALFTLPVFLREFIIKLYKI